MTEYRINGCDDGWIATTPEQPYLSWWAPTPRDALQGLTTLLTDIAAGNA